MSILDMAGLRSRSKEFNSGAKTPTHPEDTVPQVREPDHGPWASHGANCKCNVCR